MIEFQHTNDVPYKFTGICKILQDNTIRYYKDGLFHRHDGPAIIWQNGAKSWRVFGKHHREDGAAIQCKNGYEEYCYNDIWYSEIQSDDEWFEKVRSLKLEIFK